MPTQAKVSQAAHTATPVQSGAQPQARPVQPQAQAVQPQASVQPQVQAQPVQRQASVQPQVQAQPVQPTPAQPVQQQNPVQTQPAQPAVDNSAQNAATLKSNIEDQILEDLKKNNYSDVAIVRANRKYKELVKKGIMTQDEFNTKMHELLPTEEEPEEEAASDAENAESNE